VTQPKPASRHQFDPATRYPHEYRQGVDTANRLLDRPIRENRTLFVSHALQLVTEHMEHWPQAQKNALTDRQWARSAGFAHTLREYLGNQAD
jgi:hypothetical protein